jgi:oligopeptidase B
VTNYGPAGHAAGGGETTAPPVPKSIPRQLGLYGETRVDDLFWLRDASDPEVTAHLQAENAYTAQVSAATAPLRAALYEEMLAHTKQTDVSAPYRRHGYSYYTRTQEGQQYPVHCRRKGSLTAPEEVLLDLNLLAEGKAFLGLGAFVVSDDGSLLAYSIDVTGYRQYALRVKDLRSGITLAGHTPCVGDVVWARDNRTLVYSTEDSVTKRSNAIWRRELPAPDAVCVYFESDELFDVGVDRSRDGAFIFVHSQAKDTT